MPAGPSDWMEAEATPPPKRHKPEEGQERMGAEKQGFRVGQMWRASASDDSWTQRWSLWRDAALGLPDLDTPTPLPKKQERMGTEGDGQGLAVKWDQKPMGRDGDGRRSQGARSAFRDAQRAMGEAQLEVPSAAHAVEMTEEAKSEGVEAEQEEVGAAEVAEETEVLEAEEEAPEALESAEVEEALEEALSAGSEIVPYEEAKSSPNQEAKSSPAQEALSTGSEIVPCEAVEKETRQQELLPGNSAGGSGGGGGGGDVLPGGNEGGNGGGGDGGNEGEAHCAWTLEWKQRSSGQGAGNWYRKLKKTSADGAVVTFYSVAWLFHLFRLVGAHAESTSSSTFGAVGLLLWHVA